MKAFLIDGTAFCYRAHYAIRELTTSNGRPTNAIYGFILILNKIIREEQPDFIGIAFDLKAPTFRHKKFKDYKVHRPPMPAELKGQIPTIKEVIEAYNIPLYEKEGYEGEDIIATIAKDLVRKGIEVYIVSADKDILQLVNDNVRVYNTQKEGLIYDKKGVQEKFGVPANKVIEVMALMGDKIDNIPGVPGIGIKTAQKLIKEFGNLENLLNNLDKLKSKKLQFLLKKYSEDARLSRQLAKIDTDVPIKFKVDELRREEVDRNKLFKIFKKLEFRTLIKKFAPEDKWQADYKIILNESDFDKLLNSLRKQEVFTFSFETTDTNPHKAEPIGISICWREKETYFIPLLSKDERDKKGLLKHAVFEKLKPVFKNRKIKKVSQNIKYGDIILKRYGIDIEGIYFDTMIASYLLNPSKLNYGLDDISLEYLGHKLLSFPSLVDNKQRILLEDVELDKLSRYACEKSDVIFRLYKILENRLKEENLFKLYSEIEIPLVRILADMELNGISVDVEKLKLLSENLSVELNKIKQAIFDVAGVKFNINSPQQLREILFNRLNLPVVKRTKSGPSTDVEVLKKLSSEHKLPEYMLKYRELAKLKSGYIDSLPKLINPKTKKIHTSFNQTVTQTGRLSSSEPNLQNIPVKGKISKKIREAFIPENKKLLFLSADYSQIELRILAHLSEDENLTKAFKHNLDIHSFTASLIFDRDIEKIEEHMRAIAKTVNFSIIYGVSPYGLSKELNIDVIEAKKFIDSYFDRYPGVKDYINEVVKRAQDKGYVVTLFGRRRYTPQFKSSDNSQANFAKRVAINTPIQGTASDLIKIAMIDIYKELHKDNFSSKIILQIHDELIFEVADEELDRLKKMVKDKMENVVKLRVPVKVDIKTGKNWAEC